jgi:serine acetyltransferase
MIDHGTGIVIGETTIIRKYVSIYQGVTLGALQVEKSMQKNAILQLRIMFIYANATILGGSTIIGNHSIVGGNTFITKSVNPYSFVMQSNKNTVLNQQLKTSIFLNINIMKYNNILETIGNTPHVKLIAYLGPTIMCGLSSNVLILALVSRIELL